MGTSSGAAARVETFDPGLVRSRRGVRAVAATVLAWATMLSVTTAFGVDEPWRITLFAAGAAFEGALLAPDPQPRDRVRTLGAAAVVCSIAIGVTVQLTLFAAWTAAILLVLLIFSSYALRAWNPRIASLALIAAITVYITGGGHITVDRVGWFVLAAAIGFGWLAVWEGVILPDDPLRSLQRSVQTFAQRTADAVAAAVEVLGTIRDGSSSDRALRASHASLERVRSCRAAIDRQLPSALNHGLGDVDAEDLRVLLYAAQKGVEDIGRCVAAPDWARQLPDELAWSMSSTLHALSEALGHAGDQPTRANAVRTAQVLRGHVHDALTQATTMGSAPFDAAALLNALMLLGGGEVLAESLVQATALATKATAAVGPTPPAKAPAVRPAVHSDGSFPSPTMALAIQSVVAAVTAGVIARMVGNDQSLVVAWTAFVIIGGSAGLSTRRALVRIPATILGAVGGVLIAATVPDTVAWTVAVVAVGVFFTIVSAPVSYPAMVFWMSIAFVPLFATQGRYLDLIADKTVAALIGGCVAAVVSLTLFPIRSTRAVRPGVIAYLTALDAALASHLPGHRDTAGDVELDSAHAALAATVAAAATETNVFGQAENARDESAVRVDAVHEAYERLTPLLSDASRLLHGWTNEQVAQGIRRLRDVIDQTVSSGRGTTNRSSRLDDEPAPQAAVTNLGLSDSLRHVEELQAALGSLAALLGPHADAPIPAP